ncbi:MAG TPA: hypothetical protein ENF55_02310 [Thermoprotei archaeon]|nr:hypothetical protein [Thermoprotei archaeon]
MSEESDSSSIIAALIRIKAWLVLFIATLAAFSLTIVILYAQEPLKTISALFAVSILAALLTLTGRGVSKNYYKEKELIKSYTVALALALGYSDFASLILSEVNAKEFFLLLSAIVLVRGIFKAYKRR